MRFGKSKDGFKVQKDNRDLFKFRCHAQVPFKLGGLRPVSGWELKKEFRSAN